MMIRTYELKARALDWAVARAAGRVLVEPVRATDEDFAKLEVPFAAYDVHYRADGGPFVIEVLVTRFDCLPGCSRPTATVRESTGKTSNTSANCLYLTREQAQIEVDLGLQGGLEGFCPSEEWGDIGPILFAEGIDLRKRVPDPDSTPNPRLAWTAEYVASNPYHCAHGATPQEAVSRCFIYKHLGAAVDVPEELLK